MLLFFSLSFFFFLHSATKIQILLDGNRNIRFKVFIYLIVYLFSKINKTTEKNIPWLSQNLKKSSFNQIESAIFYVETKSSLGNNKKGILNNIYQSKQSILEL